MKNDENKNSKGTIKKKRKKKESLDLKITNIVWKELNFKMK